MGHWLRHARRVGIDRLDAQLLLSEVLQQPRTWVIAHEEHLLQASEQQRLDTLLAQRLDGIPLAYLTGWREFDGLKLKVTADVLVPRADTETLVEWASELLQDRPQSRPATQVLDLGTGSGAVALALKHRHPSAEVTGTDSSAAALAVARDNGQRLQLDVQWLMGRWYEPVHGRRFDIVVSNPPYVAPHDPHLAALQHEPVQALVSANEGLADLFEIISQAGAFLTKGGALQLEHGWDQGLAVRQALAGAGFREVHTRRDLAGQERCSAGVWPG